MVRSAVSSASCGAELAGQVTVFAQGAIDGLLTTSCSAPTTIDRSRLGPVTHPREAVFDRNSDASDDFATGQPAVPPAIPKQVQRPSCSETFGVHERRVTSLSGKVRAG